nr:MAG TPA: hypothetical protein [Caudoviricetes sp.]
MHEESNLAYSILPGSCPRWLPGLWIQDLLYSSEL